MGSMEPINSENMDIEHHQIFERGWHQIEDCLIRSQIFWVTNQLWSKLFKIGSFKPLSIIYFTLSATPSKLTLIVA